MLPFTFLSPVQEGESLSLGFADSLISMLGSLQNFVVPPTSSILKYAGGTDPSVVSRDLQVRYVLQGNIQKLASQWRVSVQLVDAERRRIVVSETYNLTFDNIFEVQDEIGRRWPVLWRHGSHPGIQVRDRYSADRYAYEEYLQGLSLSFSDQEPTMDRAIEHLTRAVERDTKFALAHAALVAGVVDKYRTLTGAVPWPIRRNFIAVARSKSIRILLKAILRKATFSGVRPRIILIAKQSANFKKPCAPSECRLVHTVSLD